MVKRTNSGPNLLLQRLFQTSGRLPWGWKLLLLALVGLYLVAEPLLERRWGIELPGFSEPEREVLERAPEQPRPAPRSTPSRDTTPGTRDQPPARAPTVETVTEDLTDYLEQSGPSTFKSPAGLVYTRGSQQGHRLKHLMVHAEDDPDRPGPHGVFDDPDPLSVVKLVDEAYRLALRNTRTQRREEGDRTIYTTDLGRPVGYVGGESGARRRHPRARHLRLIVEGDRFVTAFPVIP